MSNSIEYQLLETSQEEAWDNYVITNNAPIYLLLKWRDLIESVFRHKTYYCTATSGGKIVGILPLVNVKSLLFGNYLVSMPFFNYGGVFADSSHIFNGLLDYSKHLTNTLGSQYCEIRMSSPIHRQYQLEFDHIRTDKVSFILDLPSNPEDLWKSIGSKRRAQIKRPIREGASFKMGGLELLDDFYEVFATNMRDLGTPVYNKNFFYSILKMFPNSAQIAIVYLDKVPVGAAFLISHNKVMEIPWASTIRRYNKFGTNMYLYWNVLNQAILQGNLKFDFGRSTKDANTVRFKRQWGPNQVQLYWFYQFNERADTDAYKLSKENSKYSMMIKLWQKMPLFLTKMIGPKIIKSIP
jgi:FemAB-related protein (PEP-CTERM system-associated)